MAKGMQQGVMLSLRNLGTGLRVFRNMKNEQVTLKPGDSKTFEIHPHHLKMINREIDSPKAGTEATLEIETSSISYPPLKKLPKEGEEPTEGDLQSGAEAEAEKKRLAENVQRFVTDPMNAEAEAANIAANEQQAAAVPRERPVKAGRVQNKKKAR